MQDGRRTGLKLRTRLFGMNLIEPMHLWTSIITTLIQQLRYLNAYYKFNLLLKNFQASSSSRDANIFDELPALSAPASSELRDELEHYLTTDPEQVSNICAWWYEQREAYPRLHRVALNYHMIPGMLVFLQFKLYYYSSIYSLSHLCWCWTCL